MKILMNSINQNIILITGSRKGIGYNLTKYYLDNGHIVIGCSRSESELQHENYKHYCLDVSNEKQVNDLFMNIRKQYGRLDVLINNAGISMRALFKDLDLVVIRNLMDVNFWGTVYCTKYALPELLKNKGSVLPLKEKKTVFIPKIYTASTKDWWGVASQPKLEYPVNLELVKKYYNVTEDPSKADFAIVFVTSPQSLEGGYDLKDRQNGSNGYVPISLQYGTYTAAEARTKSIAAGDQVIDPTIKDRTYKNKTVTAANTMDLRTILDTKDMMNGKPVIVSVTASKPMIFNEFEKQVDGIVLNFGVSSQAVLDIISGKAEPSGLLPVQMPANMETVEKQFEDVPYDMIPHTDSEGNVLDPKSDYIISGKKLDAKYWSITAYDENGFLIKNPINKYSYNLEDVKYEADSTSYKINLSGTEKKENWLPINNVQKASLIIRLYLPSEKLRENLTVETLPAIQKVK